MIEISDYFMKAFTQLLIPLIVSLVATPLYANSDTPPIDYSKPVPTLSSMNRLGDLQFQTPKTDYFVIDDVPVAFTPLHDLPIIDVSIAFDVGAAYDNTIKEYGYGIANMTATMLTQGTTSYDEDDFLAKKEQLAIDLTASATYDTFGVHLRSLSQADTFKQAILLLQDSLQNASFSDDTLTRNKAALTSYIKQSQKNPDYVAKIAYNQAIFGNHPYSKPITGTIDSIQSISPQDLQAFQNKLLVRNNAHLVITGDISKSKAREVASQLIGTLKQGNKAPQLDSPKAPKAQHIHIDHPSGQTAVLMGNLTDKRQTDTASIQKISDFGLGNDILAGGDFTAHLMQKIRTQKGYTYGIYGQNALNTLAGNYTIGFATKADMAEHAIKDAIGVVKSTLNTGITAQELELVKTHEKLSHPQHFATNSDIHHLTTHLLLHDYPKDHLSTRFDRLDNASIHTVNERLRELITPNDFVVVTVGNIKPNLTDLYAKPTPTHQATP